MEWSEKIFEFVMSIVDVLVYPVKCLLFVAGTAQAATLAAAAIFAWHAGSFGWSALAGVGAIGMGFVAYWGYLGVRH